MKKRIILILSILVFILITLTIFVVIPLKQKLMGTRSIQKCSDSNGHIFYVSDGGINGYYFTYNAIGKKVCTNIRGQKEGTCPVLKNCTTIWNSPRSFIDN
jgi:hypothetical protein